MSTEQRKKRKKLRTIFFTLYTLPVLCLAAVFCYIVFSPAPPLWENLSFSPLILDKRDSLMHIGLTNDDKYRMHARLEHLPQHVQNAVLLYEDQYFYKHPGVNIFSLFRAVKNLLTGQRRIGASTIAMQVARLRFKLVTNTFQGKLHQILLALQLIWHYGHKEILEAYFSLAPYGSNIEGIEAAARIYFHQSAQNLSHSQTLALCLVPQNPQARAFKNSIYNSGNLLEDTTFKNARDAIHTKWNNAFPKEKVSAKAPPLRVFAKEELLFLSPHISMEFLQKAHNNSQQFIASTTIDIKQQNFLEKHIKEFISFSAIYGISNASAMLLHWPSMEVRALVGSADFFNTDIDGQVDGTKARRSPGSTLKPFIYALALDQGLIHPQTMLMDAPRSFAEYNPENFDKQFQGPLPAHEALRLSRNVPAIELASRIEPDLYNFLQRAQANFPQKADYYGLSLVLGGAELSMRDLVALYAMLANGGVWQNLKFLKHNNYLKPSLKNTTKNIEQQNSNLNSKNFTITTAQQKQKIDSAQTTNTIPLLSKEAALCTLYMLEEQDNALNIQKNKIPFRYKTGTSNGFRDAWTIGVIGPYILAIWVGNFDNTSNPMLVGSLVASPLYKNIATSLMWEENLSDIIGEKYKETRLLQIDVCRDTGDTQTDLCDETVKSWFIPGRSPIKNSQIYRKILLDKESGLRLCEPSEQSKEVVWEFWPSEVYALFAEAGIYKPLPPALADPNSAACQNFYEEGVSLNIQSPRHGIVYHMEDKKENKLAFIAASSAETKSLFWFVDEEFVGTSKPHEAFFWNMREGKFIIRALDDTGQIQERKLIIERQ